LIPKNFFAELKRRNVYKVAVAYAVVGWLAMQVSATIVPALHLPDGITTAVVVLVLLGFPVALVIAWAFEMTPAGMKRTEDIGPNEVIPQWSGRKFAAMIIVIAAGAAALLAFQLFRAKVPSASPSVAQSVNVPSKSIAVLPFVNMSSDRENEYFVDGLTEEILNRLAQISALRVPGRTSSFAFKGKNTDLRQVGTELGVAHVLEGSVRKSGDRLRITSQLIRTADGFHLWSQNFDRKLDDVFAIQDEIARAIADALSTPLGLSDATASPRQTKDMEVYDKFLQARALLAQRTPENLRRAIELLTAAIDRDPEFASGWAALAQARALSSYYLKDIPDPLKAAEEAARRALALDDSNALAHSALADVLRDRRDWLAAESEYARALKLSPGEAETHNQYAQMFLKVGRIDGALQHALRACELEPLGWVPPTVVSLAYLSRGDFAQSRAFLDRSEKLSDRLRGFQSRMELIYALSRRDSDLAQRALTLSQQATWAPDPPSLELIKTFEQALAGFQNSAGAPVDLGRTLKELGPSGRMPLSAVAAFVGQKEVALDAIALEAELSVIDILGLIWTPVYQPLRSEPRFLELLRGMKMPEYWRAAGWSEFCRPKGDNDFECVRK
jgi:TolB-like protein/Tfp pilus assembly protein PilF